MRYFLATACLLALAACQPAAPDRSSGSYTEYLREREAQARSGGYEYGMGYSPITGAPVSSAPLGAPGAGAPLEATRPSAPLDATGVTSGGPAAGSARVSDEQDFDAVAARESIESDRERLARQREQYVFIEPTPVPQRGAEQGPNIVQYALNTRNRVGEQVYRRMNPFRFSRWEANCAQFSTQDQAQLAFLSSGGPERDRENLDPDGDGFACWWDPAPFRGALR